MQAIENKYVWMNLRCRDAVVHSRCLQLATAAGLQARRGVCEECHWPDAWAGIEVERTPFLQALEGNLLGKFIDWLSCACMGAYVQSTCMSSFLAYVTIISGSNLHAVRQEGSQDMIGVKV
jgi:hypothetical protein